MVVGKGDAERTAAGTSIEISAGEVIGKGAAVDREFGRGEIGHSAARRDHPVVTDVVVEVRQTLKHAFERLNLNGEWIATGGLNVQQAAGLQEIPGGPRIAECVL